MAKHVLKSLDLSTLNVALDHFEEHGPATAKPDPRTSSGSCVYLAYIGEAQLAALAARLPHVDVEFDTPSAKRRKVVRHIFSRPAILHVLRFIFTEDQEFAPFVRDLGRVDPKYWRVLATEADAPRSP